MHPILIVEDDPLHLKLYSWIVERAGFSTVPMLVPAVRQVPDQQFAVAVLDYQLGPNITAPMIAADIRKASPTAPIVVLSDLMWMPDDMLAYTNIFVRKGDPEELLVTLSGLVPKAAD
jgi:CheY-like chemotaxis protein